MSALVNGDGDKDTQDFKPNQTYDSKEDEISDQLLRIPEGHHCLVLYSNIETMRKVYASYAKKQLGEQPNSILLFLSYYDNTETVRYLLKQKGIQVKEHERNGSIIILDIVKAIDNPFFEVPYIERLRELAKKLVYQFEDKAVVVIADMSVFHHIRKTSQLLDYEKNLHRDLKVEKWKEICLYHKRDFECMFTEEESNELMEYHADKVIRV
jgi:MEDS: MEthanogen/methylotroph, DcmR Sensory domain